MVVAILLRSSTIPASLSRLLHYARISTNRYHSTRFFNSEHIAIMCTRPWEYCWLPAGPLAMPPFKCFIALPSPVARRLNIHDTKFMLSGGYVSSLGEKRLLQVSTDAADVMFMAQHNCVILISGDASECKFVCRPCDGVVLMNIRAYLDDSLPLIRLELQDTRGLFSGINLELRRTTSMAEVLRLIKCELVTGNNITPQTPVKLNLPDACGRTLRQVVDVGFVPKRRRLIE